MRENIVSTSVIVAEKFARALDADDYESASVLLHDDCAYDTGKKVLLGKRQIIESYLENSNWVHSTFDEVIFESEIEHAFVSGEVVPVRYTDRIRKDGLSHIHQCRQILTVNGTSQLITSIEHQEIDGESARLSAFFKRCGVQRTRP